MGPEDGRKLDGVGAASWDNGTDRPQRCDRAYGSYRRDRDGRLYRAYGRYWVNGRRGRHWPHGTDGPGAPIWDR